MSTTDPDIDFPDLDSFLSPASIAVVGASASAGKIGAAPLRYLIEHGYAGEIYPVNPRGGEIAGLPAHVSLRAISRPIDLAIFAIPAAAAPAALDDAIAAGVKNIVMFSAGYAEMGEHGARAQGDFADKAAAAGIRVLGPNCLGFMNSARSVYATFSPVVSTGLAQPGTVGIVSQSGAFGAYAYAMARQRGVGLSAWISTGNESDIDVAACIAWMARNPATRIIMAYLEGCRDGARLRRALDLARVAGKPVVLVKVGRTTLGAATAASHTAALAGDDAAYDALFRQHGAWRANNIEEFFDIAHCLAVSGLPANPKVGLLTVSGGVGVMMADDAAMAGLDVAELPATAQERIRARVPFASTRNPVDLTGQVTAEPDLLEAAARVMLGEAGHGSLLIFLAAFGSTPAMRDIQQQLARDLRREFPGRLLMFGMLADTSQQRALEALGCLCFSDPARAIRVLAAVNFLGAQLQRPAAAPIAIEPAGLGPGPYNEADAMDLLQGFGIPVVPARRARNQEEAVVQACDLGFPVAMKVLSPDITHKSDIGAVILGVPDAGEAGRAYERIVAAAASAAPGARVDGVLVAPMIRGGVEFILGVRRDPSLGAVVMLGAGGVQAELMGDVALRLAPVDPRQAREMIEELKTAPLLRGFRGAPPADEDALAEAIVNISRYALAAGDTLEAAELNPFVVLPRGQGALALDAVVLTRAAAQAAVAHAPQTPRTTPQKQEQQNTQVLQSPRAAQASHAVRPPQAPPAARLAVIATLPLFEMARMRAANTARRHLVQGYAGDSPASRMRWVNQFTHTRRLRGPQDKEVVTPNNDTLFTNAWLDLSAGPLLIDVPEMGERYWVLGFLDAWTNPWAYAGRRTTGGAAQRLFVHGPGWTGSAPAGMHRIAAPGDDVWIIGRILADADAADLAQVHALQDRYAISRPDGAPALSRIDTLLDGRNADAPQADEYLCVLETMLARNPPAAPLPGWPPAPADLQQALAEVYTELRETAHSSELGGGWTTAVSVRDSFGDDLLTRARVARNWIGTLGIDEAMYIMAEVDADGAALSGARRYVLRFPPGGEPDVGAFWSITLYRRRDCLLVDNPIGRHSIGDRTRGLLRDADGGLSISIQADDPGPGKNWLPAPPEEGFYLTLRLYQPGRAHLQGTFGYPPVKRTG
ncbi:acetate--CoA ligase family protein [Candidimonas humi]|uniref:Acetate--CoA ligase family protein n=1 Tax=Candidimonas humi TaxID=683355 RepID=A0ABV8NSK2_9BURK|nr:acetate--CoA ligase family protein [Candidimonas humi]MBV6307045.1 acetate--CoA ligase family protein [Candidimonas humi]